MKPGERYAPCPSSTSSAGLFCMEPIAEILSLETKTSDSPGKSCAPTRMRTFLMSRVIPNEYNRVNHDDGHLDDRHPCLFLPNGGVYTSLDAAGDAKNDQAVEDHHLDPCGSGHFPSPFHPLQKLATAERHLQCA